MNANELIEAYVTEVAAQLPRRSRNDVAFELRALLTEEWQARLDEAEGHLDEVAAAQKEEEKAIQYLRAFGRPADVAARYRSRPPLTVIDPEDGHGFVRAAAIGLAILWTVGLWVELRPPIDSASDLLLALGRWWGGVVIPSLWWPGLLVVGYGTASWTRRRWPQTSEWKPRAADHVGGGRTAQAMALVGILVGIVVLIDPRWILDLFWGGRAAPAAYQALTYTETFRGRQAPFLLALLWVNIPLFLGVLLRGRRSARLRRLETGLGIATCAVMVWTVWDGPVFQGEASDRTCKFLLVAITITWLTQLGIQQFRSVKPAPNRPTGA